MDPGISPIYVNKFYCTCFQIKLRLTLPSLNCRDCGCALTLYDRGNYQGRSLLIKQQIANFGHDYYHDRAESARVIGNCKWLLYQHSNFAGEAHLISAQDYSTSVGWGGNGNRFSSARALPPAGKDAIVLFQHGHFKGRMLVLYASDPNLPLIEFNDQLSSFIITGGRWTFYEHTDYSGRSSTYGPGEYTGPPSDIGHDRVSAVQKH